MVNSRAKGARAERELANKLKEYGFTARRGQQYSGANGDADVVCTELAQYHIECKMVAALNVDKAIDQATRDCGDKTPIVCHRKNNRPWLVTMYIEDFLALVQCKTRPPLS
jgi:Holliday junction resolvase